MLACTCFALTDYPATPRKLSKSFPRPGNSPPASALPLQLDYHSRLACTRAVSRTEMLRLRTTRTWASSLRIQIVGAQALREDVARLTCWTVEEWASGAASEIGLKQSAFRFKFKSLHHLKKHLNYIKINSLMNHLLNWNLVKLILLIIFMFKKSFIWINPLRLA